LEGLKGERGLPGIKGEIGYFSIFFA
jgi:hypothetical protein